MIFFFFHKTFRAQASTLQLSQNQNIFSSPAPSLQTAVENSLDMCFSALYMHEVFEITYILRKYKVNEYIYKYYFYKSPLQIRRIY